MKLREYSSTDISKKIKASTFVLPVDGKKKVCRISGINAGGADSPLILTVEAITPMLDKDGIITQYTVNKHNIIGTFEGAIHSGKYPYIDEIPEILPSAGFYNMKYCAYSVALRAPRTFRAGLTFGDTDMHPRYYVVTESNFMAADREFFTEGASSAGFDLVGTTELLAEYTPSLVLACQMLSPSYYSFYRLYELLCTGVRISGALSPAIALGSTRGSQDIVVWYGDRTIIGKVVQNNESIRLVIFNIYKFLEEEIREACHDFVTIEYCEVHS